MKRAFRAVGLLLALVGCADGFETLRPASGQQAAIRAEIVRPNRPGPFPAVVILHGCAGATQPNYREWAGLFRAEGYLSAIADQFGPHGISEVCTGPDPRLTAAGTRLRDTYDLIRILQARPDVQADRVFLIGYSHGAYVTALAMTLQYDLLTPPWEAQPTRPRGAISMYGACSGLQSRTHGPLLFVLAELDDWAPVLDCQGWVGSGWQGGVRPRMLLLPGVHHAFDNTNNRRLRYVTGFYNPWKPDRPHGATIAYDAAATDIARREVLAFLRSLQ